jgi:hypothetical protein
MLWPGGSPFLLLFLVRFLLVLLPQTKFFCPQSHQLLKDIVQDYCQPISSVVLQDEWVGISDIIISISKQQRTVRNISLQLRPDAKQSKIFMAVREAFMAVHPKHYRILNTPDNSFQAIGADGNISLWFVAVIGTHRQS